MVAARALLLAAFAWHLSALADAKQSFSADEENTVVLLAVNGREDEFKPIIQAVRGQLSDLDVSFQVTWLDDIGSSLPVQEEIAGDVARDTEATVIFWCDLSRPERMYLYISVPELGRVLVRRLDGSGPGGTPETLAIIVRGSVDSMLRGNYDALQGELEPVRPQPEQAEPEPVAPPPEEKPQSPSDEDGENRLAAEVAFAGDVLSENHPFIQGFALVADVYLVRGWHLFAGYLFSAKIENGNRSDVRLDLERHPMSIGTRFAVQISERWFLGASVAVVVDYTTEDRYIPRWEGSAWTELKTKDAEEILVSIAPLVRMDVQIIDHVRAFLALGVDIPLNRVEYFTDPKTDEQQTLLFSSWPVRPVGRIGVAAGFL